MRTSALPHNFLASGPKLFVLDTRNAVERDYLLNHLQSTQSDSGNADSINFVSLRILDENTDMRSSVLAEKLRDDPQTMVVPLRVAWQLPGFEKKRVSKKRHVLLGDPRQPGKLRAWAILKREPRRAHCLIGQPASIQALQERFKQQNITGDQTRSEVFA
ncbi:MAG: hypothetical protein HKN85_04240, partial [Gammaproteobacteria bacterium]|nr:hypothetical protein [Gammaproteobacteria bacterium]